MVCLVHSVKLRPSEVEDCHPHKRKEDEGRWSQVSELSHTQRGLGRVGVIDVQGSNRISRQKKPESIFRL